jgi:uncharacterized membrane protein
MLKLKLSNIDFMWANPLTIFGNLSMPLLFSNSLTLIGFILAAYFAISYTKSFYADRPKPKSWLLIVFGLIVISFSEVDQFIISYVIGPTLTEGLIVLVMQSLGIILVAFGTFLLYKEVP